MKHLLLLTFILFVSIIGMAQSTGDMTIYSNTGERFYVILNGVRQNKAAETNVKITDLTGEWYSCRILAEDKSFDIEKNLVVKKDSVVTYRIVEKRGKYKVKFYSQTALKASQPIEDQTTIVYHPTESGTVTNETYLPGSKQGNGNGGGNQDGTGNGNRQGQQTSGTTQYVSGSQNGGGNGGGAQNGTGGGNQQGNQGGNSTTTTMTTTTTTTTTTSGTGNNNPVEGGSISIGINVDENGSVRTSTNAGADGENINLDMNINVNGTGTGIEQTTSTYEETTIVTTTTTNSGSGNIQTNTNNNQTEFYQDQDIAVTSTGGCLTTDQDMANITKAIKAENFGDDKMRLAKTFAEKQCMSLDQVREITLLFDFADERMTFLKTAHLNCLDQSNYYMLSDVFTFSSDKEDFNTFLQSK
jgi:hypothetical protein